MRRFTVFSLVVLSCAAFTAPASASPPEKTHITYGGVTFAADGVCPFTLTIMILIGEIDQTTHFDDAGRITTIHQHFQQQDAFSANGHTLVGEPYAGNADIYYDNNGNVTNIVAQGVLEKVTLPDGRLFIGAGRVNPFTGFALSPDHGAFKNLDAFCAALAP